MMSREPSEYRDYPMHYEAELSELSEDPVEKLSKADCARLFEFDSDAPLVLENKDYREVIGLNRGTDDSRRTFAKPDSPDYMLDSGIGKHNTEYIQTVNPFLYLVFLFSAFGPKRYLCKGFVVQTVLTFVFSHNIPNNVNNSHIFRSYNTLLNFSYAMYHF